MKPNFTLPTRWAATALPLVLFYCAWASGQSLTQYRHLIEESQQRLEKVRAAHDEKGEAIELIRLGELQAHAGEAPTALVTENKALEICIRLKMVPNAGVAVQDIGWIYMALDDKTKADTYLKMGLDVETFAHDTNGQADTLFNLGDLSIEAGLPAEGLDYYNRALRIQKDSLNRPGEASALIHIGDAHGFVLRMKEALDAYNKALSIYRDFLNALPQQAIVFLRIATVQSKQGEVKKAISSAKSAVDLLHKAKDPVEEANARTILGAFLLKDGDGPAAQLNFDQALELDRERGDKDAEASNLIAIGVQYSRIGRFETSLQYESRGLDMAREEGDDPGVLTALIYMGYIYEGLGQDSKSIECWSQALKIATRHGWAASVAMLTSHLSTAYSQMGNFDRAVEFGNRALSTWRAIGNPYGEAGTLHTLGWIYETVGQHAKALDYFEQALPNHRMVNDLSSLFYTLRGMGEAEEGLGNHENALVDDLAALSAAREFRAPPNVAEVESTLMRYWRNQKQLELAAFFGIEAINTFQQIRQGLQDLGEQDQVQFVKSKSQAYRDLAEILVQLDLLGEAEQVLDMLKEQELREVVRGEPTNGESNLKPLPLTHGQQVAEGDLASAEAKAAPLVDLNVTLKTLAGKTNRSAEEEKQLSLLRADVEQRNSAVSRFFSQTLYPELGRSASTDDANKLLADEKSGMSSLQSALAGFGPTVVGIRVILGEHVYALLITSSGRTRFDLHTTPVELRREILQAREDLRNPGSDPRAHLSELYAALLGPMNNELEALERSAGSQNGNAGANSEGNPAPTILWSLDGSLRYLPIAALFDGRRYMVERFNNVLFTPESYAHWAGQNQVTPDSGALAMGLSKSYRSFPALPGVLRELMAVVHDPAVPGSHGPLNGQVLPDEKFTYSALKARLEGESSFPVIHIASHFVMNPGEGPEPYLLLSGDEKEQQEGYRLTLSTLDNSTLTFKGTHLLTLSACSTGKPDSQQNGMEVESLGMIAQRKDAEAVLASLWDVNDESTARLMSDFYARWQSDPSKGKAEALRKAQLALLQSQPRKTSTNPDDRGLVVASPAPSILPGFSHPYYWAPFVLTGNFR